MCLIKIYKLGTKIPFIFLTLTQITVFPKAKGGDLWQLGRQVNVLLLNGERFLDFPRPFPPNILHLGTLGSEKKATKKADEQLEPDLEAIYKRKGSKGQSLLN
jgi:hypothetical protein